jgi:hypothetical protein
MTKPLALVIASLNRLKPAMSARATRKPTSAGTCVGCGLPVGERDAFLRYRGEYYHAGPCRHSAHPTP